MMTEFTFLSELSL